MRTLSRLNRCHPDKTAELADATDPHRIIHPKAKLTSKGPYDAFAIERVVQVLLDPNGRQSELIGALEPIAQRLMHADREARLAYRNADGINDPDGIKAAKDELDALTLFRSDMGTYVRLYTFLCQIFDYGNTALETRAMAFKRLLPLLEFEREVPTVDLSKVVLTHHHQRNTVQRKQDLAQGEAEKLQDMAPGGGSGQDKDMALLAEIIAKLNDLFTRDLSETDNVTYVRSVIPAKLLDSTTLQQQASANSKEQFGASPDLGTALWTPSSAPSMPINR